LRFLQGWAARSNAEPADPTYSEQILNNHLDRTFLW
jgi:hypothetical protein